MSGKVAIRPPAIGTWFPPTPAGWMDQYADETWFDWVNRHMIDEIQATLKKRKETP